MSAIKTATLRAVWRDAQTMDEFATTRFWEYIARAVFRGPEWIISSQQPPSLQHDAQLLRRVDLVVEHLPTQGGPRHTVLFMEAKKTGVPKTDALECETQAWDAAYQCNLYDNEGQPRAFWLQTCIGTTTRFWVYNPKQGFPTRFLPGDFKFGNAGDSYVEFDTHGEAILDAYDYIAKHLIPPSKFLATPTPSISSPSSSSRSEPEPLNPGSREQAELVMAAAAGRGQIPLAEDSWMHIKVQKVEGDNLIAVTAAEKRLRVERARFFAQNRKGKPVWVYIGNDRCVYWTETLQVQ